MAGQMNYDYDLNSGILDRRQKLLEALQGQAISGSPTSIGGALARVAQAYLTKGGLDKANTERQDLSSRYKKDLVEGMQKFYDTSQDKSYPNMVALPNEDGSQPMVNLKGDKRKAIFDAMASNHPQLQALAMEQLKAQDKNALTAKDLIAHANPDSVFANPNDPSKWTGKSDLGEVNGIVYDKNGRKVVQLGGPQPTRQTIAGDLYESSPSTGALRKLDNAPKVSVSSNPVIMGQKAGMQEYFKNAADQVKALGVVANTASNNKQTISELRNLDSQGIFSNVTSGPATFLSNLGQAVGVKVDPAKLANTESYNALSTDLWQGLVSKFGGNRGVTKEEAAEIKRMLPLAANSPQARQQLFKILDNSADRQIMQYQNANSSFAKAVKKEDPELFSQDFKDTYLPAPQTPNPATAPGPAAGQPMSLEDYLKKAGGR